MSKESTNTRVLITGGFGYIGGRITLYLKENRPDISIRIMTTRNSDQWPDWSKDIEIMPGDVLDKASLNKALNDVTVVIHLAALNENDCVNQPDLALEVNGLGTYNLLQACQIQDVTRIIYFSTFHVYGPEAINPITELTPTRPVHPYAFTHRIAEDYVNWFRQRNVIDTMIIRLSNGYGFPADVGTHRWTLAFNDFCKQAIDNGEIVLRSHGDQHRDFVTLEDIARGTEHILSLSDWGNGILNFGGGSSFSIHQAAQYVANAYSEMFRTELPIIRGENRDSAGTDPVIFEIEALKATGFSLTGDISQELKGTLEICQEMAVQDKQSF